MSGWVGELCLRRFILSLCMNIRLYVVCLCAYIQLVPMYVGVQESVRWGGDEYVACMYVCVVLKVIWGLWKCRNAL